MNHDEDFEFPENQEESPCEHCQLKIDRVESLLLEFMNITQHGKVEIEVVAELFEDFYELAYQDGETNAYENIGALALDMAHHRHNED